MENDNDIYKVPYLFCCKCGHDLNHPLYKICTHPFLQTPLCVVCFEEIKEEVEHWNDESNEEEDENKCHWCFLEDGLTLFLCDNDCSRQFCSGCVEENLGRECLNAINHSSNWMCFSCDPKPLSPFTVAVQTGKDISSLTFLDDLSSIEDEAEIAEKLCSALKAVVLEICESLKKVEPTAIIEKTSEIREEILKSSPNKSFRYFSVENSSSVLLPLFLCLALRMKAIRKSSFIFLIGSVI
jgi:hypothetical protein